MQLPHSKAKALYIEKVKEIEISLKEAMADEKNEALLGQAQEHLDTLAEKYQYDDEIGTARYKLYELQALIHYLNDEDEDALDFIDQAVEMRGADYPKAQQLKSKLSGKATTVSRATAQKEPMLSESDREIATTRQAVKSAGLWAILSGAILALVGLLFILISKGSWPVDSASLYTGMILFAVSIYFFYSGYTLHKCDSSDDFTKKLLGINIAASVLTIWSIFPLLSLVMSITALQGVRRLDGKFASSMQNFEKIEARINRFRNKHSVFFYRSPIAVIILTTVTFGIYSLYWVYKHWSLIGKSTKEKTYPVLSALFFIFTIYPLSKRIQNGAVSHGYTKFQNAGWAAAGLIIVGFLSNGLGRTETTTTDEAFMYVFFALVLSAGSGVIMATIQRAANAHNLAVLGEDYEFKSAYIGEIILSIIGVVITVFAILGSFLPADNIVPTYSDTVLDAAYSEMEYLRGQYDTCSQQLESKRPSLDLYNEYEVNAFNYDADQCETKRLELNASIDEYNRLSGFDQT